MWRGLVVVSVLLLAATGCNGGKSVTITQYPDWNWEAYERIAVVPVQPPSSQPEAMPAAEQTTFMLDDLLASNGNFEVLSRSELREIMTEQDLSRLADVADPSTVIPEGKFKSAQALVIAKLTTYSEDRERIEERRPVYATDRKGRIRRNRQTGQPIVVREEIVETFRHAGTVAGYVRVVDPATGQVLLSYTSQPITYDAKQQGGPPRPSPTELAIEAAQELAVDLYTHVAPIETRVKLKSDMLVVALDYYDGEYEEADQIPTTLDTFLVAVRELPRQADRNTFRVAVAPEEGRNVWEEEFVWSANNTARGVSFEVPTDLLRSTGAATFVAKLYGGRSETPVLDTEFEFLSPTARDGDAEYEEDERNDD